MKVLFLCDVKRWHKVGRPLVEDLKGEKSDFSVCLEFYVT